MGAIKDRNGMDLTEAEGIKKRWQKKTQKNYIKKNPSPLSSQLYDHSPRARQPGMLSLSVTTNKASGGDVIPAGLFQILKDDAVKVLYSIWQQIWQTHQWPQDWKRSIIIPFPKKGNVKECFNYGKIALISHASNGTPLQYSCLENSMDRGAW